MALPVRATISKSAFRGTSGRARRKLPKTIRQKPATLARKKHETDVSSPSSSPACNADAIFAEATQLHSQWNVAAMTAAVQKLNQAQECWRLAGMRAPQANALEEAGEIYFQIGQYQDSRDAYEQALKLWQELDDQKSRARYLSDLSLASLYLGRMDDAGREAAEAITLSQKRSDNLSLAHALNASGKRLLLLGQPEPALAQFEQSLALAQGLSDQQEIAQATMNIGHVYADGGALDKAVAKYLEALRMWEALNNPWAESKTVSALVRTYIALGDSQKALDSNQRALELAQRIGDRTAIAASYNNAGYAYASLGQGERALEKYRQALKIFQEIGLVMGQIVTIKYVGNICATSDRPEEAKKYYDEALSLISTMNPPPESMRADVLNDLGLLYCATAQPANAIRSFRKAYDFFEHAKDWRGLGTTLNNIGNYYRLVNQLAAARQSHTRALEYVRGVRDHAAEVQTLYFLARVELESGKNDEARKHIEASVTLIESARANLANRGLQSSYGASVQQQYQLYIDVLMRLNREHPGSGLDVTAFQISERARARSLIDSLKELSTNIQEGADSALLEQKRALQQQLNARADRRMSLSPEDTSARETLDKEIDQLTAQYDEIEGKIRAANPRYAALMQPQPLSVFDIQRSVLDDKTLLLEYVLGDERSYVWAVSRTNVTAFELPRRAEIEDAARKFYQLLTASQPVAGESFEQSQARISDAAHDIAAVTATLSDLLLRPVFDKLGDKRLLIVADGALQYIPFQALTVPGAGGALTDQRVPLLLNHEIANEPSASALAMVARERAARRPPDNTVVVFADPVFGRSDPRVKNAAAADTLTATAVQKDVGEAFRDIDGTTAGTIPPLPASREEAEAIISVVPWNTGLKVMNFDASRKKISQTEFSKYRIVHFATHGFVDYQHPELSGLVLSLVDENGNPQAGFLRMHDIYNLKLPVDLVVLSACNTGLGKEIKGEGLMGLTRGFMYAGAGGVVASLWKVDDDATAELMKEFYAGMFQKGLTPAAALREAQLSLRLQKRWQSPYYWAAFVIQGQSDQTELRRGHARAKMIIGAGGPVLIALILMSLLVYRRRRLFPHPGK